MTVNEITAKQAEVAAAIREIKKIAGRSIKEQRRLGLDRILHVADLLKINLREALEVENAAAEKAALAAEIKAAADDTTHRNDDGSTDFMSLLFGETK